MCAMCSNSATSMVKGSLCYMMLSAKLCVVTLSNFDKLKGTL